MKDNRIHVLIQPSGSNDYWIKRLLDGIRAEAQQMKTPLAASYFSVQEEAESLLFSGNPVLLAGTATKWIAATEKYVLSHAGTPVFVNACMPELQMTASGVCFSLEQAVKDCMDYLKQLGAVHPVLIGLNPSSDADQRKAEVFREYADKNDISGESCFCDHAGLEESIGNSISDVMTHGADALLCSNDTTAILAMTYLRKQGITAGETFPVIGMGNSFLGMNAVPPLTTVNFDYYMLGKEAVRLYHYLLGNEHRIQVQTRIPANLIVRESTGGISYICTDGTGSERNTMLPDYFGGNTVSHLIMLENDLQRCDDIDREIIFGTARGETYTQLAERLYLSERTLKYRLSHILGRLCLHNKSELCTLVQEVFGNL